jgi:hypothetical protein
MQVGVGRILSWGVWHAARQKLLLTLTGVGAGTSLALESWSPLVFCGASCLATIAVTLASPKHWQRVGVELRRRLPDLPDPEGFSNPEAIALAQSLRSSRETRKKVEVDLGSRLPERLLGQARDVHELEAEAIAWLNKADQMERYITGTDLSHLGSRIQRLEYAVKTSAGTSRSAYQMAEAARQSEMDALVHMRAMRQECLARAAALVAILEATPSVLMCLANARDLSRAAPDEDAPGEGLLHNLIEELSSCTGSASPDPRTLPSREDELRGERFASWDRWPRPG